MGAKYLPNIKDQKATQRFQRIHAQKNPTVKPGPSAAQPKPEKKK